MAVNILLLEPDVLTARNITRILRHAGHSVVWCRDAQSAVSQIDLKLPDLIICELQLSGHSGVEFLYELRSYPEWQKIPLIVLSHVPASEKELEQFNISKYHYKVETKLENLTRTVNQILQKTKDLQR